MLTPVQRVVLGAVVALVGLSAALALASLLPRAWIDAPPERARRFRYR